MKVFHLESSLWIPRPLEQTWEFFTDFNNYKKVSPNSVVYDVIHQSDFKEGSTFSIELKGIGNSIPSFSWHGTIEDIQITEDMKSFADVLNRGPFSYWRHTHFFSRDKSSFQSTRDPALQLDCSGSEGTWMRDSIDYSLSLEKIGELGHKLLWKKRIEDFFYYRYLKIKDLFPV